MSYRHAVLVPIAIASQCNQVAHFIGIDPQARLDTLSVALVPAGGAVTATATHMGACGCMDEEQREYLEANQEAFPGAMWWRWHETGPLRGLLAASHDGEHLGEPWSWAKSLATAGLKLKKVNF